MFAIMSRHRTTGRFKILLAQLRMKKFASKLFQSLFILQAKIIADFVRMCEVKVE